MKKALCACLALILLLLPLSAWGEATGGEETAEDDYTAYWVEYDYRELSVGNATPLTGRFSTSLWGGTTSDIDVRELLHGYNLVKWDGSTGRIRFDRSVVSGPVVTQNADGSRNYYLPLYDDMVYSDESPITAWDYAFSLLLQMDPVIEELGGERMDVSWLQGSDAYLSGETEYLSGLRVLGDYQLAFTVKAEALPYFFELARFSLKPYPVAQIAPDIQVRDDGQGAYLSAPFRAEELRQRMLDPETGYLTHPKVVSGPFVLLDFDGVTASFRANNAYKGNENGEKPELWTLHYTLADNQNMITQLSEGMFGLLNKVTMSRTLLAGIKLAETQGHQYTMSNYPRTGLTMLWFVQDSPQVQDAAVRKAIAHCLDRDAFIREYVGPFGLAVDGYYGLGQWMYQVASGGTPYAASLSDDATEEEIAAYEQAAEQWEALSLEGLTHYGLDEDRAVALLAESGWTLNEQGEAYDPEKDAVRCKRNDDGTLTSLKLTLAMPQSPEAQEEVEKHFLPALNRAGISVQIRAMNMEELQLARAGQGPEEVDMVYLGENFSLIFDPETFDPGDSDTPLAQTRGELYDLARRMVETEPGDALGYMQKWVTLQERISQTLPLIPIYSNVYFDFYTRELYDYRIADAVSWAEAVLPAYMSEPEYYDEETDAEIDSELAELERLFMN